MSYVWISHLQHFKAFIPQQAFTDSRSKIQDPPAIYILLSDKIFCHIGSSTSGHSFSWCSYILGIVPEFPRNSFLIGSLGLISFSNAIQWCEKKSFGNLMFSFTFTAEAGSSAEKIPPKGSGLSAGRAFACVCITPETMWWLSEG